MKDPALEFVLAQTKNNVEFLVSQRALSQEDGDNIIQRLDSLNNSLPPLHTLSLSEKGGSPPKNCPDAPMFTVMALWDYSVNYKESGDLPFKSGDIIHVIAETNAQWWLGKCNGKRGLFPASYVERLRDTSSSSHSTNMLTTNPIPHQYDRGYGNSPFSSQRPSPYSAPYVPNPYQPPGAYSRPQQYQGPVAPLPQLPGQPAPQQSQQLSPKHQKYGGKLGSTLAQSAVGGAGFGAGSAIGSGIVHAIF